MDGFEIGGVKATGYTNLTPLQKTEKTQNTVPIGQTNVNKSDDFYGGMVQFSNKVPAYTGPESMGNYLDYLVNNNIL